MSKWFDDKLSDKNVRQYTKRNLRQNKFERFSRSLSLTNWLIIINVVLFLLSLILESIIGADNFNLYFALSANTFFLKNYYWTLLSSMFLHGSFDHILANMISLFFIGNFVEKLIGRKRFFWLYIISGIFAGLFFVTLSFYLGNQCLLGLPFIGCIGPKLFFDPSIYAVGASGAIFALLGLLAVLTPKNKVYLIAGPLIAIVLYSTISEIVPNSSAVSVLGFIFTVYFLFSIFAMFSFNRNMIKIALPIEMQFWLLPWIAIIPLVLIGLFVQLPIGNTAHLGGLLAGMAYGYYIKTRYKKKSEYIEKIFTK